MIKSFKKCGISNNLDGTEDKMLYEECGSEGSSSGSNLAKFSGLEEDEFSCFEPSSDEEQTCVLCYFNYWSVIICMVFVVMVNALKLLFLYCLN